MIERPRQAVILAGGRGARLGALTDDRPKPMVEIHGRPFLAYLIDLVREQGFTEVLLLLGYRAPVVLDYFGNGREFGVRIKYSVTPAADLTARRIRLAGDRLADTFLLMYCDNYWPMLFDRMWNRYVSSGAAGLITVYRNRDGYSRGSIAVGEDGYVERFDRTRTAPGLQGVEISYAILRRDVVLSLLPAHDVPIEEAVYPALARERRLIAHVTDHRYYSVGSPDRLAATSAFLARTPAVILDRDGVLNRRPAAARYVERPDQIEWLPGAREALRAFREAGYRVIVASNQAGVARGHLTLQALAAIHEQMQAQAHAAGGAIDAFYCCPHDWDAGCECRKPQPGLLFQAQRDFALDLTRTWFLGDDERDRQAADAAGTAFGLVSEDEPLSAHAARLLGAALPVSV
jgi:D-glycero-D-manno-heptose 1,7-bisphosphate phosphatase